ncbi:hypothetical protein GCM10027341_35720 [Spirosoma knui]
MNKFVCFAVLLAITSCQSRHDSADLAKPEMALMKSPAPEQDALQEESDEPANSQTQPIATANRKIIRNAQLRIRVSDFAQSGRAIEQAVQQVSGQITNANETKSSTTIENALTVRVPASRLDAFLGLVLKESIFTDIKTVTAEDVTRQYVDVEARIRSKKAVEETYLQLLKKARTVEDVLKIEEQLGQIREEREVQEAELRQLKEDVALSTVNLTYYQESKAALRPEEPFYAQIANNLADGFRLLGNVLVGVFYLLPLGLVVAAGAWLVSRWRRNRRKTA